MFTNGIAFVKLQAKIVHFLYFLQMTAKSVIVWAKYLSASEISYLVLSENDVDY